MGKFSRTKGAAFERWCVNEIKENLGYRDTRRNLTQYQVSNEADIVIPDWSIECKRYATASPSQIADFWKQCVDSANGLHPVLIYKLDRRDPICRVFLSVISEDFADTDLTADISMDAWFYLVRERI
jgi:hypothetical protein